MRCALEAATASQNSRGATSTSRLSFASNLGDRRPGSNAFDLGWLMAELFWDIPRRDPRASEHLPTVKELGAKDRVPLGFRQVGALASALGCDVRPETLTATAEQAWNDSEGNKETFLNEVGALHVQILDGLAALNSSLANAYMAGRSLSDMCWRATPEDPKDAFNPFRFEYVRAWLIGATSMFPPLAVDAVTESVDQWVKSLNSPYPARPRVEVIRAQGDIWRSVLTGDVPLDTLLTPDRYVDAATATLKRSARLAWRVVWHLSPVLLLFLAGAIAAIVEVATHLHGLAKLWSILGSAAGWLGLSWSTVRARLARLVTDAAKPVWQLSEADAVAAAITRLPRPHESVAR